MPAVSKAQQKFFGIVRAIQKGEMAPTTPETAKAAATMKKKDVKDFASTKHKGKPEKVKQEAINKIKEMIRLELESCGYTMSAENPNYKLKSPGGTGDEDKKLKENMKDLVLNVREHPAYIRSLLRITAYKDHNKLIKDEFKERIQILDEEVR